MDGAHEMGAFNILGQAVRAKQCFRISGFLIENW
jgi:hypothetical protein